MRKKTNSNVISIIFVSLVILAFVGLLTVRSGMFDKDPKVTAVAENCWPDTLRVITDADYRPYSFFSEDGSCSGHDVELIILIANKIHKTLDLKMMEWNDGIQATLADESQVLMTCDYSDSFFGTEKLLKTEPMSGDDFIVFSKTRISSVDDLFDKRIGVMANGNATSHIETLNLLDKCTFYEDNRRAMQAVADGEVDCAVIRNSVGAILLRELDISGVQGYTTLGKSYMCFGVNNAHPDIVAEINSAIEQLKADGELVKLRDKWLTTFVEPYSFTETIANNIQLVEVFLAVLAIMVLFLVRNIRKKEKADAENNYYIKLVENLANDFECVNYVTLIQGSFGADASLIRISDTLQRNIPEWSSERHFKNRMDYMCQGIVAQEDREMFMAATTQEAIIRHITSEDAYFVNFKAIIDGEPCFYQLKFSAVNDDEGSLVGFVCGVHNIDAQTKAELFAKEQLKEAKAQLEVASKSKTDFLFNMSHDIRTPMNAIIGFTNLAKTHIDDTPRVKDCLAKIETSGNHLLELINEVLDMSRVEAGKLKSEIKTVNMKDAAQRLITICYETAVARNITLKLDADGIRHQMVEADDLHINQVLMNILGNALKYTMPGGQVTLAISELDSGNSGYGHYRFVVEDTGIGMSPEFLTKVFDSFSREETPTVSGIQGTGLGMSIVKRLVDYLDGKIDIESERGKGTKVTVELYLKIAGDSIGADAADDSSTESVDLSGKKILLVEDNELNREIACFMLQEKGIVVDEAVNGIDAVNIIKGKGVDYYDCVLMDIQMPLMNGFEATSQIRQLPGADKLVIIALSANAFEEDRRASITAGMNDHLAKPIDPDQLTAVLVRYLR